MIKQSITHYLPTISTGLLVGITALSGILLSSSRSSAESATATVTVGSACTLTATVNTAHSAEIPAGSNQTDIGSTTLNTICNDSGGFAIYAVGYSGNEYGNNKMLSGSSYEFNTGTATSGANSAWSMKLAQVTTGTYATTIDSTFGSYSSIPATFTKVAHRDSATDAVSANPPTGSSISLTYGAYISSTQNAGTYEGKVKFTLVHPASEIPAQPVACTAGKICYNANGPNTVGTMAQQSASNNASVTLYPSNFSRQGYGFAGWSTTYDYSDPTGFYGPNETITTPADTTTNGLSLYAIWVKSAGNLQGWTGCSSLVSGEVTALKDLRDNDVYAVAKLADDNCWMIENLRLDNTNSDNATGALAQGYGGQFAGLADPEGPSLFNSVTTANSLYSTDGANNTIRLDVWDDAKYRFPRYNNQNTTSRAITTTTTEDIYSYGNYYTWAAVIADTTNYSSGDHNTTSICPTGWTIPLGNTSTGDINQGTSDPSNRVGSFSYLDRKMGGTGTNQSTAASLRWRKYPNNFIHSGDVSSGLANDRGSDGCYWSSTAFSVNTSYILDLRNSGTYVYPGTYYNGKPSGYSVRCLTSDS